MVRLNSKVAMLSKQQSLVLVVKSLLKLWTKVMEPTMFHTNCLVLEATKLLLP